MKAKHLKALTICHLVGLVGNARNARSSGNLFWTVQFQQWQPSFDVEGEATKEKLLAALTAARAVLPPPDAAPTPTATSAPDRVVSAPPRLNTGVLPLIVLLTSLTGTDTNAYIECMHC